ncbi:MAG: Holliday junction branch migration protein RuvA [Bacteroidales bacterium]|jgi:Holliday junction DNA helicase RuvA|nr:Holliday junction branch migration protein RuvA [Bacteroidales bacterium]MDD4702862.1 Holliday junction branch migration protein RuvA [Bacteroidales bacterium]MDX9797872.1 Holliday junction branch migration protein RuvA [Bacteroidales bacterium]
MYEFIEGKFEQKTPSTLVVNAMGIGYLVEISLTTYSEIKSMDSGRILIHFVVRDDAHQLFGFFSAKERELFRYLISVNGVGVNTARMMLSSMNTGELHSAIVKEDINSLRQVKGIGAKTAQRLILELKDSLSKLDIEISNTSIINNKNREEALLALQTLGFSKLIVERALDKIVQSNPDASVELLIKQALKVL